MNEKMASSGSGRHAPAAQPGGIICVFFTQHLPEFGLIGL
jgi:hypothetical protein